MTEQRSIGLVIHHHREEVRDLALRALAWCEANGRVGVLPSVDAGLIGRPDLGVGDDSAPDSTCASASAATAPCSGLPV
ncbi:MAG: hypothetical protein R2710_29625 [Acidimicrobiales bacterium]